MTEWRHGRPHDARMAADHDEGRLLRDPIETPQEVHLTGWQSGLVLLGLFGLVLLVLWVTGEVWK